MRLPGIPDEVEPVRGFEELRSGLSVWETNCDDCGGAHRFILLNPFLSTQGGDIDPCWTFAPTPPCSDPSTTIELIGVYTVESGDLWRVVDPALESSQPAAARKREPVRT